MTKSERDELRRAIARFQELATPHNLLELLEIATAYDKLPLHLEDVSHAKLASPNDLF